jgi:hypothetical protein
VLWYFDFDETTETWIWRIRASTDRLFGSPAEAAAYLLFQAWQQERTEWNCEMFHEMEDCGDILSEADIVRIAEKAFGESWNKQKSKG